jgi:hypothetical protein
MYRYGLLAAVLLKTRVEALFQLYYPPSIGFDVNKEGDAPCGGFVVNFFQNNVTDFHVGGDAISIRGGYETSTYQLRATLDLVFWTVIGFPLVIVGVNDACTTQIVMPESYAGNQGLIQVIGDTPGGVYYQV